MAILMALFMLPACFAQETGHVEIGGEGSTRMIRTKTPAKAGEHGGPSRLIRSERQASLVAEVAHHVQGTPSAAGALNHLAHSDVFCNDMQFDDNDNNYPVHMKIESVSIDASCCTLCRLHLQCQLWIRDGPTSIQEICWCKGQDHIVSTHNTHDRGCNAGWKDMEPCIKEFDYLPGEVLDIAEIDFPSDMRESMNDAMYDAECCKRCLNTQGCKYWQRQVGVQTLLSPAAKKCWLMSKAGQPPSDATSLSAKEVELDSLCEPVGNQRQCRGGFAAIRPSD